MLSCENGVRTSRGCLGQVELREDVVEHAVLEVRHPVQDLDGDDDRHRPDEHEPGSQQHPHDRADADEQQRDQRPEHDRQPDVHDREDDRPHDRVPEHVVVQDRAVVLQADPVALRAGSARRGRTSGTRAGRACRPGSRGSGRPRRTTGETRPYGTPRKTAAPPRGGTPRRRPPLSAARRPFRASRSIRSYDAFSVYVMLSLAVAAACLTVSLPGQDLGEHRAEDIPVLDVDPVLRSRDEPAAERRPARSPWRCSRRSSRSGCSRPPAAPSRPTCS